MMETSLIDFSYTHPWADELIMALDAPPSWLCDLATAKSRDDQIKAVREFALSEPFETVPSGMVKFWVACLWLRYERRELSWATFLRITGEYLDPNGGDWDCETPYHFLNVYEDAYFTPSAEERTKRDYLKEHDLQPWITEAKARFAPFLEKRKAIKAV
jgi:hypothetical protein